MRMSVFVASFVVPFCAATAFATDRKVPQDFSTIADAVAAAQDGDRIVVGPGVYQENVTTAIANLQFIGRKAVWDGTLTNGTSGTCLTATGGGTLVQGFAFRGGQNAAAQVQLTGDNCKVVKCSSRGPSQRFLKVTGNGVVVDKCQLFAVDSLAMEIVGDNATVTRLSTQQCDDDVVRVTGNAALVTRCKFNMNEDGFNVHIVGTGGHATFNTSTYCDETIYVDGADGVAEGNRAVGSGYLQMRGDNLTCRHNTITNAADDQYGIYVQLSPGPNGGGVIEDNVLTQISSSGMRIDGKSLTIRNNRVTNAGTESGEHGYDIRGTDNTIEDCSAVGSGTHGFSSTGANNVFNRCVAVDSAADGFHIDAPDNTLTDCKATANTGEGLDNGGTGTTVTGCTFKGNRIDVANDGTFSNDATFAQDNSFTTGGVAQAPQID